jgi:nitroimidazol reductase NimA-like FMN-containing flavoprotein (pyridoxamine 5'-phosphate oxidase superfamily)
MAVRSTKDVVARFEQIRQYLHEYPLSVCQGVTCMTMTKQEREAFLADVHVGIVSIPQAGRGPLTVPVWYRYEPGGEVQFATGQDSRKGRLLTPGGRISLCV